MSKQVALGRLKSAQAHVARAREKFYAIPTCCTCGTHPGEMHPGYEEAEAAYNAATAKLSAAEAVAETYGIELGCACAHYECGRCERRRARAIVNSIAAGDVIQAAELAVTHIQGWNLDDHHGVKTDALKSLGFPQVLAATLAARMTKYWGYGSSEDCPLATAEIQGLEPTPFVF